MSVSLFNCIDSVQQNNQDFDQSFFEVLGAISLNDISTIFRKGHILQGIMPFFSCVQLYISAAHM